MSETQGIHAEVKERPVNAFDITLPDGHRFMTTSQYHAELYKTIPFQPFPLDSKAPDVQGLTLAEVNKVLNQKNPASNPEDEKYQMQDTEGHITRARTELSDHGYYIYLKKNPNEEEGRYFVREAVDLPMNQVEVVAIANALLNHEGVKALIGNRPPIEFKVPEEVRNLVVDITERQQQRDVAEDQVLVPDRREYKLRAYKRGQVLAAKKLKWLSENNDRFNVLKEDYSDPKEREIIQWLSYPANNEQFAGHFYEFLADDPLLAGKENIDKGRWNIEDTARVWLSGRR